MIVAGADNEQWSDIHMQPEQTVQTHEGLRGRWLLPIHNGTFDVRTHRQTNVPTVNS